MNYCYLSCILVDCCHITQSILVGLVTINYKCFTNIWQVRPSVTFMVSEPCDCCHATGRVEALETSFFKIEQQICRILVSWHFLSQNFVLAIRSWGEKINFHESFMCSVRWSLGSPYKFAIVHITYHNKFFFLCFSMLLIAHFLIS